MPRPLFAVGFLSCGGFAAFRFCHFSIARTGLASAILPQLPIPAW